MNIQIQDKNVLNVMARFKERSEIGIKKYKTTLERTDLSTGLTKEENPAGSEVGVGGGVVTAARMERTGPRLSKR